MSPAWIACAKQLPDDNQTVLVHCPRGDEPVWPGYMEDGLWWDITGFELSEGEVTHWMPFPEPPTI